MGFGGFLKKAVGVVTGGLAGFASGGPAGALLGAASGLAGGGGGGSAPSSAGTAADPRTYINIRLPGVTYPEGSMLVDLPEYPTLSEYPTLPQYIGAPNLPTNIPTMPTPVFLPATAGETGMAQSIRDALDAYRASINPTDPRFRALAADEAQLARDDFLKNLRLLSTQNKRLRRSGGAGLLDPERSDESIMSAVLSNARNADLTARMTAQQKLNNYGGAMLSTANAQRGQADLETGRRKDYQQSTSEFINQVRQDAYTRSQNTRQDYVNRLNMLRADIIDKFNVGNTRDIDKYNAKRNDILSALNLYRGNQAQLQPAIAAQNFSNARADAYDNYALVGALKNFIPSVNSFLGGGGQTSTYASNPWRDPDTGVYHY